MNVFIGFRPSYEMLDPKKGGAIPPNHWNNLFSATFGNESLEKNNRMVDCLECGTPNCSVGAACPNCDVCVS